MHGGPQPLIGRLFGAIFLRRELYESVAAEPDAWRPATALVCLAAFAQDSVRMPGPLDVWLAETLGTWAVFVVMLLGITRWLVYATVLYAVARLSSGAETPYGRILRCIGFAEAPSLLILFAHLEPAFLLVLRFLVGCWLLASTIVAVRAALAVDTRRAAAVGVVGFAVYLTLPALAQLLLS
jgi:hypothetical protein